VTTVTLTPESLVVGQQRISCGAREIMPHFADVASFREQG
jgi:hypothetical protein